LFSKQTVIYIYMKTSNETPRYYVGSSNNLANRISSHRSRVIRWSKGNYNNASPIFYNSVLKYGWSSFKFGILEYVDIDSLTGKDIKKIILEKEQYYLNNINPSLNVCKIAYSPLGVKRNNIFSLNLSIARRGLKNKPFTLNKFIPKVITSEAKLKLSARSLGVKVKIFDKSNNLVNEFPTMTSAAKFLGVSRRIVNNILNTGISYDDYTYKFEAAIGYYVIIVNKKDNSIKEYCSISAAAKDLAVRPESISKHINTNNLLRGVYLISRNK